MSVSFPSNYLCTTASAVRRRDPQWLALAASEVAASAEARAPGSLAAADRVSGPAFRAAVLDPVVSAPVDAVAAAAECRLLVLDRSSVHVRPDAQRVGDCRRADPAHRRRAAVP